MKKTVSLRIDLADLRKLDNLHAKGLPTEPEQIRRVVRYYVDLNIEQQLIILEAGYDEV